MRMQTFAVGAMLSLAVGLAVAAELPDFKAAANDKAPEGAVWVDTLDVRMIEQAYRGARSKQSVDRKPLTINGTVYAHGFGTAAPGTMRVRLKGGSTRFVSLVGIDDEAKTGAVKLTVKLDGKEVQTKNIEGGSGPQTLDVDLTGANEMIVEMANMGDGADLPAAHVDFAGAMIYVAAGGVQPDVVSGPEEAKFMLPRTEDGGIHINGARVIGATPGRPFLYKIAATGTPEMKYSAEGLPAGLTLDEKTGVITGSLKEAGVTVAALKVEQAGEVKHLVMPAERKLVIVGGEHKLALTPPMGWNSWNVFARTVDQEKVKASADQFIKTGLAAHGFTYINIDDCWEAGRDAGGMIQANEKFPDMKGLGEYIHSLGLKFGIYSSPGPKTCAGFTASYQHEDQDAQQWANWGVDYVKYDWCSYGQLPDVKGKTDRATLMKPYEVLRKSLDKANRDIVYSLCQYGNGNVWEWGASPEVGGNLWRTTGDITDTWSSMSGIWKKQVPIAKYAGPGHWNDPDMLIVGKVGWGKLHDSKLTQNEQMTHIATWSMLSAPLLIGCDLTQMDDFTLAVLTNDEVLAIDQDPLGKQAEQVKVSGTTQVWKKTLWDGTVAVGLYNTDGDAAPTKVSVSWSELGLSGSQPVRDLWYMKDVGEKEGTFEAEVPRHGVVLVKIGKPVSEEEAVKGIVGMYQK